MKNFSLGTIPFFDQIKDAQNILIAGAGGGFDIYCGIPIFMALHNQGKNVHLANLSFTMLEATDATNINDFCFEVKASDTYKGVDFYFPEKYLAIYLAQARKIEQSIYAFQKTGAIQLQESYELLREKLNLDTIILVDGGTDSLMFGDESGLGTPGEDSSSIAAVNSLEGINKFLLCLGFGIDHFHGVCHEQFLENVNTIQKQGGFLGNFSLHPHMTETQAFLEAVAFANSQQSSSPSIVANSIASALYGHYGDYHATQRTLNSRLWINPLMYIYWAFELDIVAQNIQYLDVIKNTSSFQEILFVIGRFRELIKAKPRKSIPL